MAGGGDQGEEEGEEFETSGSTSPHNLAASIRVSAKLNPLLRRSECKAGTAVCAILAHLQVAHCTLIPLFAMAHKNKTLSESAKMVVKIQSAMHKLLDPVLQK